MTPTNGPSGGGGVAKLTLCVSFAYTKETLVRNVDFVGLMRGLDEAARRQSSLSKGS